MWAEGEWGESLKLYELIKENLSENIRELADDVRGAQLFKEYYGNYSKYTFFKSSTGLQPLEKVMTADFISKYPSHEIAKSTSPLYKKFRLYKAVSLEHEAKILLQEKKFYQAERYYQEILEEEDEYSVAVYSDVATVYNRLGRTVKETELLEKIKEINMTYPALKPVVEQKSREQQPHLSLAGKYLSEDGRDGYKDIVRRMGELKLKLMPTPYQELSVSAQRTNFGDSEEESLIYGNSFLGDYQINFSDSFYLKGSLGIEKIEEGDSFTLYELYISGSLDEIAVGHIKLNQNPVYDNINSITQGIVYRDAEAGITIDYLPMLFVGFNAGLRDYNDDNEAKFFDLWASYRLFMESSKFDVTYRYEKFDTKLENRILVPGITGLFNQPLYWSPGSYWLHSIAAEYRKELWPLGKLYSGTSFVSAKYEIGFESIDNLIQEFELNIFLEISRYFLLKGTLVADWSEDYSYNEGLLSLIYRW